MDIMSKDCEEFIECLCHNDDQILKIRKESMKNKLETRFLITKNMILVSFLLLISIVLTMLLFNINQEKPKEIDELIQISGEIEYITKIRSRNSYIAIGLKEDDVEYRIFSIYFESVDEILSGTISKGDTLHLYIDSDLKDGTSVIDETKDKWTYTYVISSDDEYYLSYEEYVNDFNENTSNGIVLCKFFSVLQAILLIILIRYIVKYNKVAKKIKKETCYE